jgi:3-oxoacyl-[acyl-carrier-protein] synthase-3
MRHAAITGWGMAVPDRVLSNADLERLVDTSDEWIVSRTGIRERRIIGPGDSSTSLGAAAARQALDRAGLTANDVDLIITATYTPDHFLTSQASLIQAELGGRAGAFDLGAACSGFVYAVATGTQFIRGGLHERVLIIGVDTQTRFIDYTDRGTCVLFGDGAGAVVLEATTEERGMLSSVLGGDGSGYRHLYIPGWQQPEEDEMTAESLLGPRPLLSKVPSMRMNGNEVFRFAVRVMGDAAVEAVEGAGLSFEDVDMLIPHQANQRIIEAAARRLKLPLAKVWINLDRYGNTSAASIPMALCEAVDAGKVSEGDNIVFVAFGAGLSWASGLVRWGDAGVCRLEEQRHVRQ